jgi:hypothetical protein
MAGVIKPERVQQQIQLQCGPASGITSNISDNHQEERPNGEPSSLAHVAYSRN